MSKMFVRLWPSILAWTFFFWIGYLFSVFLHFYFPHKYLHDVRTDISDLFPCSISTLQTALPLWAYSQIRAAHLPTQVHGKDLYPVAQCQIAQCDTQLSDSYSLGHKLNQLQLKTWMFHLSSYFGRKSARHPGLNDLLMCILPPPLKFPLM